MDPIDSLSRVLALLRREVDKTQRRQIKRNDAAEKHAESAARPSAAQVKKTIAERLHALDKKAPGWEENASLIVVTAMLSWELGDQVLLDARFPEISRQVTETMLANPSMRSSMLKLINEM